MFACIVTFAFKNVLSFIVHSAQDIKYTFSYPKSNYGLHVFIDEGFYSLPNTLVESLFFQLNSCLYERYLYAYKEINSVFSGKYVYFFNKFE